MWKGKGKGMKERRTSKSDREGGCDQSTCMYV
jgi:hypothetical protein